MEISDKYFDELTASELLDILEARAAVFVVEQNCVYQDPDEQDRTSLHVCLRKDGRLIAYLRIFTVDSGAARIGRVLTLERGCGYGMQVFAEAVRLCREKLHAPKIILEAQCYATGFYEKFGFTTCSDPFIEDGIPHIMMERVE